MGTNGPAREIRNVSSLRNASPKGMPNGKEMKRLEIVVEAAEQASDRGIAGANKRHCVAPLRDTLEAQSDKEVTDHIGR